jgi:aspartyl/asparaginyl-tRNA synthetase
MESRETFSKYMYDLHELINKMLKKKSNLTYEDVKERYEHFRSRCTKSLKNRNNKTKKVRFSKKISIMNEKGCTQPLYGEKSKCILKIVPHDTKCETLEIDNRCVKKHLPI